MTADSPEPEDDLQTELAYLAQLLGQRPGVAPIVMHRLGAIGAEARIDVERLKAQRAVKLKAPVPLPRRRQALARVAAAMVLVVAVPALGGKAANATELAAAPGAVEAAAPQIVVRVMDTGSGKPLPGVKIKTVADEVIAVTGANGQATIPPEYQEESVLSLERDGYPMVLVEGSRLSARSLIAMRKFADVGDVGLAPRHTTTSKKTQASADDPAERLYRLALEHSTPKREGAPKPPSLAAKPETPKPPVLAPAIEPVKPAVPVLAAKPAVPTVAVAAKPVLPEVAAKPVVASLPKPVARPTLSPDEAAIVILPKAVVALAKPVAPVDTSRAMVRVVKVNEGEATKAARSLAVNWTEPAAPARPAAASKAPERVASADEKAPRAIRVLERVADNAPPKVVGAPNTADSPLGLGKDQLAWVLPDSASQGEPVDPPMYVPAPDSAPALVAANPIAAFQAPRIPVIVPKAAVPKAAAPQHTTPKATQPTAPKPEAAPPVRVVKAPVHLPMPPAAVAAVQAANDYAARNVAAQPPVAAQLPLAALPKLANLPKLPEVPKQLRDALPKPAHHAPAAPVAPLAQAFKEPTLPAAPSFGTRKPLVETPVHVAEALQPVVQAPVKAVQAAVQELKHELTYHVKSGDTLSAIAQRELGSAALWPVLYNANRDKLTNPRWLQIGLSLEVPRTSGAIAAAGASSYVVKHGDTLSEIARDQLGDVRKWPQIFAANRHLIKNPWLIFPGQRLVIPSQIASGVSDSWANLQATASPPADGAGTGSFPRFGHAD